MNYRRIAAAAGTAWFVSIPFGGIADASGQVERRTHDYRRHGTTTLFAALNVKTSELITQFRQRYRSMEFRQFPDAVAAACRGTSTCA